MQTPNTKKTVLIIASENFRDEELFNTQSALAKAKIQTVIASTRTGTIKGMLGGKAVAATLVKNISVDDYDAIIFIGGSGAKEYFNNQTALNIARQAKDKGKILAAICIAPSILANAGVLKGIKAACFPSEQTNLRKCGAILSDADVEKDGLIITGSGPAAANQFGKIIAESLAAAQ